MTRPIVALTATTKMIDGMSRVRLNEAYVDAVRSAGLTPLVLPPIDPDEIGDVLDGVAGVVLTGGEDVDPAEYGAERHPTVESVHPRRDACELALVRAVRQRGMPTLAICRGIQVVNVALGGTLIQDIPTEHASQIDHDRPKDRDARLHHVSVEPKSRLAAALGETSLEVNSSHHQAIAKPAAGLKITARSPDGIIEGAEWSDDDWWMLAVQWHPEELTRTAEPWDRGLFRAFSEQVLGAAVTSPGVARPVRA